MMTRARRSSSVAAVPGPSNFGDRRQHGGGASSIIARKLRRGCSRRKSFSHRPARAGRSRAAPGGSAPDRAARAASRLAHEALLERPPGGLLDVAARQVDQVHVVDAARAGRHAGQARQAAIEGGAAPRARRRVVLEHVLDEVDASARAVALVSEKHVGRAVAVHNPQCTQRRRIVSASAIACVVGVASWSACGVWPVS